MAENLKVALAAYAAEDVEGAMTSIADQVPLLAERRQRVRNLFEARGIERFDTQADQDAMSRAFGASSAVWLVCLCRLSAGASRYQLARASVSFPALRNWPTYWPQGAGELRAGELCAGEIRVGKVGIREVGAGEVGAGEVRAGEPGSAEVGAAEVGTREVNRPDVALRKPTPDHGNGRMNVGTQ